LSDIPDHGVIARLLEDLLYLTVVYDDMPHRGDERIDALVDEAVQMAHLRVREVVATQEARR
jgi:hypothetical protein